MWNSGYVSEADYTFGHYSCLSPNSLKLVALLDGGIHSVPDTPTYLELGFGQGVSLNMHAACNAGEFWGTDFSPSQTAVAARYAQWGAGNLQLFDSSFEELRQNRDLPQFDIIVLHGIWSWVPEEVRKTIVRIARDHLKPGGLFYLSYNTKAGWEGVRPLRDLLANHYRTNPRGTLVDRVTAALDFGTQVLESGAKFFTQNPLAKAQLQDMKQKDPVYVAHEFFNATWHPMNFSEVCDALGHAKLTPLGSSTLADGIDGIHLTAQAQTLLSKEHDPQMAGDLRDIFTARRFRRDVFVKGLRRHTPQTRRRLLLQQKFVLMQLEAQPPTAIKGALGTANLDQDLYGKILEAFSRSETAVMSVADLLSSSECRTVTFAQMDQAIRVLAHLNLIAPVSPPHVVQLVEAATARLNAKLCQDAEFEDNIKCLASPLIGTGVGVTSYEKLFINCLTRKLGSPPAYLWKLLEAQGQRLRKEGSILQTKEANLTELEAQFEHFQQHRLPLLHRLGVVSAAGELDLDDKSLHRLEARSEK